MSHEGDHKSMADSITEKIHEYKGSSSSSDSDSDMPSLRNSRKKHLFGRRGSVHTVLGGGKSADIILWRNTQISGSIFAGVTVIWFIFEWLGYHLLALICYSLILLLAFFFLWSNAASFVKRSPPTFPDVILPEDLFLKVAHLVRHEINEAFITFCYVASGQDLKTFLKVTAALWVLSVIGSWYSFLTLCYILFVALYSLPALYEKFEDHVDAAAEKGMVHVNNYHAMLKEKVLKKIPRGPVEDKKHH